MEVFKIEAQKYAEKIIGCYLQSAGLTPFSTPFALATPNK